MCICKNNYKYNIHTSMNRYDYTHMHTDKQTKLLTALFLVIDISFFIANVDFATVINLFISVLLFHIQ